jgi:hypothetical protein
VEVDHETFQILGDGQTAKPPEPTPGQAYDPWIHHLQWLFTLKECGCRFALNDLTPAEWDGLAILQAEVNLIDARQHSRNQNPS